MRAIIDSMDKTIPILAMSATFRNKDMNTVSKCLGIDRPSAVMRGPLARRNVLFRIDVTGDPTTAIRTSTANDLAGDSTVQEIWYSNTKTNAEGFLLEIASDILDKEAEKEGAVETVAMSLTGSDGIMQKILAMDSFTNYGNIDDQGYTLMDGEKVKLVRVQIPLATSAANWDVSSK